MNGLDPVVGRVAYSKAGRDKGKLFIVVGIIDEDFVLIADGDMRPVERPKKKRIKHLKYTDQTAADIADKIKTGTKLVNAELRDAIREIQGMLGQENEGGF